MRKIKKFELEDHILPILRLPNPCPISIEFSDGELILNIGMRDWEWDLSTGDLVNAGTYFGPEDLRLDEIPPDDNDDTLKAMIK